jgi:hypothetical protein
MNLQTVEIPRAQAREAAAEYTRAAKRMASGPARTEFEEIARAYRLAARDETPMIALTPTIVKGGTCVRTVISGTNRRNYLLPNLAACRADAAFVYTLGIQRDGKIELIDSLHRRPNYRKGRLDLELGIELPSDFRAGETLASGNSWWKQSAWSAMVPIVPPKHRPAQATTLASYLVLWEVEEWAWTKVPQPPGDPALLRRVGGDIYAVIATWDLTELEKLVLTSRVPA